jgi:diguanylate cyclase (GGDEF)-like protein/PAS domain S-box-containing protein
VSAKQGKNAVPDRLPWLAVFGVTNPAGGAWDAVRGAQLAVVAKFALARFVMTVLAACIILASLRDTSPGPMLNVWFAGVLLVSGAIGYPWLRKRGWAQPLATRTELHRETLIGLFGGLMWLPLPMMFSVGASPEQIISVWTVITAAMAGTTLLLSAVPAATTAYLVAAGGCIGWMMLLRDMPLITLTAGAYTLSLILSCAATGRSFILHRTTQDALAEKDEVVSLLLREFEDSGGDWMWQTDASKCLTHVSPRFAYALGAEADVIETQPFLKVLAGESWEAGNFSAGLRELAEHFKNRSNFSDLIIPVTVRGETFWWELSGTPRFDENGIYVGFRGVGSDVTEAHRSADKINRMARFDTLTGLPNRLQVTEALGAAMAEADRWRGRCGFMMIDLDRFKAVNDTLGHPMGDRLLTRVAERLKSVTTDNELCGRLGGDEFGVVVKDAKDASRLAKLAHQIIETLSKPYEIDQHTMYIGASVGTAIGPRDGRSVEMLIRSADLALYRSKDEGGNAVHAYQPQLHVDAEERRVIEIALRQALDRNEFEVHYQPVVNAATGNIESFEALLRWTNPELGPVSPAKFVPVAEDARLIGPIGEWVLRTACAEAATWPSAVGIAVNVSAEQLADPGFATVVVSALSQSGLQPGRLELEVTESVFMREGTAALAVLQQVLSLGVRLALDDFGTGYSSLGYLSKTKFSTIKIDRSFVQGAAKNVPASLAIIRAVVALAESLGMATTAEGVETDDEARMLSQLGCRKIQGYLYGRPMAAPDAKALIASQGARAVA